MGRWESQSTGPDSCQLKSLALKPKPRRKSRQTVSIKYKPCRLQSIPPPMLMANELPEDLVTEILLCLPVVSLLRFNCACKSWYALITHQNFIRKHLLHNKNNNTRLFLWQDETTRDIVASTLSYETLQVSLTQPLPLPFTEVTYFVGSCDGLVCLSDYDALNVVIWNPATKETKVVPNSSMSRFSDDYHIMSGIGFGFDAKTSDYKIIKFFSLFDPNESDNYDYEGHVPCYRLSEVYSLSVDSWRKVDSRPGLFDVNAIDTYINGMASWEAFDFDDNWEGVLSFDMSGEVFLKTPLPDDVLNSGDWRNFFVLNESIAMVFSSGNEEWLEICCDIWLLLEVGVKDSWTKLFTVGPITGIELPLPFWQIEGPLTFWQIEGPLTFWKNDAIFCRTNDRLILYNPFTKERTNLPIQSYSCPITYMETLVSVKGRNEF
ncbi:F-box/kelch-repeat protein At3g23880-like [Corylus avellana]|uniref:F-box/kelch-repeat protein At3g23880-like n=1 Tax=Corylus avellana TaxID=13451 RepID=UPI001E1FE399|nr:F-box/kelch-repeat protein At3g23880-like [Corylus avellana]